MSRYFKREIAEYGITEELLDIFLKKEEELEKKFNIFQQDQICNEGNIQTTLIINDIKKNDKENIINFLRNENSSINKKEIKEFVEVLFEAREDGFLNINIYGL